MQHYANPRVCVANKELTQYLSPLNATFTENSGGGSSVPFLTPLLRYLVSSADGKRVVAIMDSHFQRSSCSCAIASSAAPDGTSVKLVTACGDSPAGPAPTTPNRSTLSSAPSISAAISSTLPGPTAPAAASKSSEKFSAPTRIIPVSAGRTKNSM